MKLLKLEWIKLKGHSFFLIGLSLYAVCMILVVVGTGNFEPFGGFKKAEGAVALIELSNLADAGYFKLPFLWHNITYVAGILKFIPTFIFIFFVGNEYRFKTYRQGIINGLNKTQFFTSKLVSAVIFSFVNLLIIILTGFIISLFHNENPTLELYTEGSVYLIAYFSEVLFMMVFAMFFTLLFRSSTVAIVIVLLYWPIEFIVGSIPTLDMVKDFLPTFASREMILQPFTRLFKMELFLGVESPQTVDLKYMVITYAYMLAFIFGGLLLVKKRDA